MMRILEGQEGVVCRMDDVLVFGRNQREHDDRLEYVLQKMNKAAMTLNQDKYEFNKSQIKFLGHIW